MILRLISSFLTAAVGMQAQGHVQFLNYFVFGMDLQTAIDAPRSPLRRAADGDRRGYAAGSDPRKDGMAVGY